MDYKEAFFKLLDERVVEIAGESGEEKEQSVKELFELFNQLEDQEEAKDWVAQTAIEFVEEDEPFIAKAIIFIRPGAFEKLKEPEKATPEETKTHGGDEAST